jgi:hypothetical protein
MAHPIDPTTHTIEMGQIAEINQRLQEPGRPALTAADLDLSDVPLHGARAAGSLSGQARLVAVDWSGAPTFPNIYGEFAAAGSDRADQRVLLHTEHLRELSRRLGLRHRWGL